MRFLIICCHRCCQVVLATDGARSVVTLCFDNLIWDATASSNFLQEVNAGFVRCNDSTCFVYPVTCRYYTFNRTLATDLTRLL